MVNYKPRPKQLTGITTKKETACGKIYITVNSDKGGPFEIFVHLGKAGGCAAAQLEAITRLTTLAFRSGISKEIVIKQLSNIKCPSGQTLVEDVACTSCADAIARALTEIDA